MSWPPPTVTPLPPPTSSPREVSAKPIAAWLAATGGALVLVAAVIVVAGNWQDIAPAFKFAGLVAATIGLGVAAEHARAVVPATARAVAHLAAALTAPVGIAAAAVTGATWPVCVLHRRGPRRRRLRHPGTSLARAAARGRRRDRHRARASSAWPRSCRYPSACSPWSPPAHSCCFGGMPRRRRWPPPPGHRRSSSPSPSNASATARWPASARRATGWRGAHPSLACSPQACSRSSPAGAMPQPSP